MDKRKQLSILNLQRLRWSLTLNQADSSNSLACGAGALRPAPECLGHPACRQRYRETAATGSVESLASVDAKPGETARQAAVF